MLDLQQTGRPLSARANGFIDQGPQTSTKTRVSGSIENQFASVEGCAMNPEGEMPAFVRFAFRGEQRMVKTQIELKKWHAESLPERDASHVSQWFRTQRREDDQRAINK